MNYYYPHENNPLCGTCTYPISRVYIPFTIFKLTSRVQTLAEVVAAVELFPSHGMGGAMGVAS